MTPTQVFSIAGMITTPMWILMIFFPKWKVTNYLISFKIVPIILSFIYTIYIINTISINGMPDYGNLDSVMKLFTEENAVLAGWVHYLVFDLIIGMWILNASKKLNIHQLIIAPCLFATFMFGPVGFLLFFIIKIIKQNKLQCS
ncbi:DUF4281 domain-containing protein [Tenacibaculum sp. S7007]|uniref:DUF4281 domain-containing protein n=1 Tax=Tenacibaculum pelagium TaxID=2759527 RepID=A0A839ANB3_9FLAO|nr:ABA4-like family protein [Tenacibaculum pelagium]MBA6155699.1 DUF4281 domain-containing protein [Tenacibaculum pelagium]